MLRLYLKERIPPFLPSPELDPGLLVLESGCSCQSSQYIPCVRLQCLMHPIRVKSTASHHFFLEEKETHKSQE